MKPVVLTTTIAQPRNYVFSFLDDLANREAFLDHYLTDWQPTSGSTYGVGAAMRMKSTALGRTDEQEIEVVEASPQRIVELGRGGDGMKRRTRGTYDLADAPGGGTRVTLTLEVLEPANFQEKLGGAVAHRFLKKENERGLERLKALLEG